GGLDRGTPAAPACLTYAARDDDPPSSTPPHVVRRSRAREALLAPERAERSGAATIAQSVSDRAAVRTEARGARGRLARVHRDRFGPSDDRLRSRARSRRVREVLVL